MNTTRAFLATVIGLALLAGGLRFYRLGDWPFFGDELSTFDEVKSFVGVSQDSSDHQIYRLPRLIPVSHTVQYLGYCLFGWDEFGSRALMALLGTVQVVLVFLLLDRPLGRLPALVTALLVALWPEHVYRSQENRFYITASFFASLCMLAGGLAVQRRSMSWTLLASLAGVAGLFAHTLQGVVLGGLFAGLVAAGLARRQPLPWRLPGLVLAVALLAGGLFVWRMVPLIHGWNSGEEWGETPGHSVLSAVNQVGWPVALLAAVGALFALEQRREQGWYWLTWLGVWAAASVLFPLRFVYHSAYIFPLALGVFVLAGGAVAQVYEYLRRDSPWAAGLWIGVACGLNLPALVSHYQDGGRQDFRTAAHYIARHWQPGDRVAAVAPGALRRYAPVCKEAVSLAVANPLPDLRQLTEEPGRLWIVIPSGRAGKKTDLGHWLGQHCTLELKVRSNRFDYRDHVVEVFLYAP
jgi:hypothetical protein